MKLTVLFFFSASVCFAQPGVLDLSFNPGSGSVGAAQIQSMCLTSNGQILIAGDFLYFNDFSSRYVARLNSDGSLDQTFYVGTGPNLPVYSVASQNSGMVLIAGYFLTVNGHSQPNLARLRVDGSLDMTFTNRTDGNVYALANLSGDSFLAGGSFEHVNGNVLNNVARFNADGSLDSTFQPGVLSNGTQTADVHALAVQSNGFVVIGGDFSSVAGQACQFLARLDAFGAVDASFVGPGIIGGSSYPAITCIVIETNGQIVVGGHFTSMDGYSALGVARLNADGSVDGSFHPPVGGGPVNALALQPDGKVLVGENTFLERLNSDGSLDTTFSPTVYYVDTLAVQPDGRILLAGDFDVINGVLLNCIARLLGDSATQAGVQLLNMNLYPGMFLSGSIGTNYRVEYTTNLTSPSLWTPLTSLVLTNSPAFIADPTLPHGSRFYRAVTIP